MVSDAREPLLEHSDGVLVVLAEQGGRVAGSLQAQLEPADAGEEARHTHSAVLPTFCSTMKFIRTPQALG